MVVFNVAVQDAPPFAFAPAGVQVIGAPILALPFWNWTVPVGPWLELLFDPTTAVRITGDPEVTDPRLLATRVVVAAGEMVTLNVLLLLF
jgi:hypothetical protein